VPTAFAIDEDSYTIRFTPRKARSDWRAKPIKRVRELYRTTFSRHRFHGVQSWDDAPEPILPFGLGGRSDQ
jgi:hypothetical protein